MRSIGLIGIYLLSLWGVVPGIPGQAGIPGTERVCCCADDGSICTCCCASQTSPDGRDSQSSLAGRDTQSRPVKACFCEAPPPAPQSKSSSRVEFRPSFDVVAFAGSALQPRPASRHLGGHIKGREPPATLSFIETFVLLV